VISISGTQSSAVSPRSASPSVSLQVPSSSVRADMLIAIGVE
jgi:hypothetical protein